MLKVEGITAGYGATEVLHQMSFTAPKGEITTLIGTNGAGKSTTLNTIMGVVKARQGTISWCDRQISGLKTSQIVKSGIVLVPEGRHVFPQMSVSENLYMGAYVRRDKEGVEKDKQWVMELFPRLKDRLSQPAGTLSGGEQQMLALGRAIMGSPELILMDEPSMGLAPVIVEEVFEIINEISRQGKTILLVEQNAFLALGIARQAYVIELGQVALSGTGEELRSNPEVERAYLGL